jgi:hypothetical protein
VEKKDAKKLRPCQDYRYLNEFTKPNAYPLPLISDLMITLKGSKFFTKLDIRWGYNNVRIKEGDEWKAAFITNKGLFEPTVMFFGLRNSPTTFQAMMKERFYWPGMAIMTKQFIDGCAVCQQMKTNTHPTAAPLMPIKSHAHRPFQQVTMDFITDLPISNGFDSIFIVVDQGLSKGVILCVTTWYELLHYANLIRRTGPYLFSLSTYLI